MIYAIEYEHLKDEFVFDKESEFYFNQVKDGANKYKLELSDDDFLRFLHLEKKGFHADWIMSKMTNYNISLLDTLILLVN